MSVRESPRPVRRSEHKLRREGVEGTNKTVEIALYVADMIRGMRQMTKQSEQKDLAFLDYLLATVQDEALTLSSRVYH